MQGPKLCFGNDLTGPAIWSDILNNTVQKFPKGVQALARIGQKMIHLVGISCHTPRPLLKQY